MMNKTRFPFFILLIAVIVISGCGPIDPPATAAPVPSRTPTKDSTPTVAPTETETPAPTVPAHTATPKDEVVWEAAWKKFTFQGVTGTWANSTHAYLYEFTEKDGSKTLMKVTLPGGEQTVLGQNRNHDDYAWAPDDRAILISSSQAESILRQVFIMDADGKNPRLLSPDIASSQYLWFHEWLDAQNLIYEDYTGGGHINVGSVNIQTGQGSPWGATIHGKIFRPNNGYIPATDDSDDYIPRLLVISRNDPSGKVLPFPGYGSIPRTQTTSTFDDWLPGSSQMLVFWGQFDPQNWQPRGWDLLLWNVETNNVRLIAPNGTGGQFSPDGSLLAYLTRGPAKLDQNQKPVPAEPLLPDMESDPPVPIYLQLMEMQSGSVSLSLPVLASFDIDDLTLGIHTILTAQFSPDGRYLAFFSPGQVQVDAKGWPVRVDESQPATINLLDLQEKKLVWSSGAANKEEDPVVLSWSPKGDALVYQDQNQNWQLLDVQRLTTTPITKANGEYIIDPAWSYDGRYLSLTTRKPLAQYSYEFRLNILEIPLPER